MDTNLDLEKALFEHATEFIFRRYPNGWGGVAVLRTSSGKLLTSVSIETPNEGASLCIETGAICEAHKIKENVTHSICVVRDDENASFKVLTPCGICQERLMYWKNVRVAVTSEEQLTYRPLSELQPYHWSHAYGPDEIEHFEE